MHTVYSLTKHRARDLHWAAMFILVYTEFELMALEHIWHEALSY